MTASAADLAFDPSIAGGLQPSRESTNRSFLPTKDVPTKFLNFHARTKVWLHKMAALTFARKD